MDAIAYRLSCKIALFVVLKYQASRNEFPLVSRECVEKEYRPKDSAYVSINRMALKLFSSITRFNKMKRAQIAHTANVSKMHTDYCCLHTR